MGNKSFEKANYSDFNCCAGIFSTTFEKTGIGDKKGKNNYANNFFSLRKQRLQIKIYFFSGKILRN